MLVPDIYFEQFWGEANAVRDGGALESFVHDDELGTVLYRFIKRPTGILPGTYDTVTPYGFSGPAILRCQEGMRKELVHRFDASFQDHCRQNRLVAEYIRFSPWLKNHEDFKGIYELVPNNHTFGIDLSVPDFFMDEFSSACRNSIRRAEKLGLQTQFDFTCDSLDEFHRIYNLTADRKAIGPAYRFSKEYFRNLVEKCRPAIFLVNALLDGRTISSAMFIHSTDHLHDHLCGNDPDFYSYHANSLLIARACEWGRQHGKRIVHLGGYFNDGMFNFKKAFTRHGIYDFFVGRKIRLRDTYDHLVALKGRENPGFFPAYRG